MIGKIVNAVVSCIESVETGGLTRGRTEEPREQTGSEMSFIVKSRWHRGLSLSSTIILLLQKSLLFPCMTTPYSLAYKYIFVIINGEMREIFYKNIIPKYIFDNLFIYYWIILNVISKQKHYKYEMLKNSVKTFVLKNKLIFFL